MSFSLLESRLRSLSGHFKTGRVATRYRDKFLVTGIEAQK
jgi:hypothetical protein